MRPNADWGRAATTKHVLTAVNLTKWAILFAPKNENVVKTFCGTFREQAPKMGIQVANPRVVKLKDDRTETFLKELRGIIDPSVQLVVTIFPQLKSDRYFYLSTNDAKVFFIVFYTNRQRTAFFSITKTIFNKNRWNMGLLSLSNIEICIRKTSLILKVKK